MKKIVLYGIIGITISMAQQVFAQNLADYATPVNPSNGTGTATAQVQKQQWTIRNFLMNRFLGKEVPVLDSNGNGVMVGTNPSGYLRVCDGSTDQRKFRARIFSISIRS